MKAEQNKWRSLLYQLPWLFVLKVVRSFWFLPSAIVVTSIAGAALLYGADVWLKLEPSDSIGWLYSNSAEGARSVLSTIAGSMITVTGVMLSAIIVVMTLASQQYGPRLVQNFIEDRIGQIVIGCLIGCFIYCVITLKSIQAGDYAFVPHLSVLGALAYAILSVGLMIFFVQHLASSIQVHSIMHRVSKNLSREIENLYPEQIGDTKEVQCQSDLGAHIREQLDGAEKSEIKTTRSGYLQSVEYEKIMELASEHDLVIELKAVPGEFLIEESTIALVYGSYTDESKSQPSLNDYLILGTFPTCAQDILFPIRQLEEIAIRALSPGINDPHTAIEAIDYLTAAISQLIQRNQPSDFRYDSQQSLRVIAKSVSFDTVLRQAFQQVHHYGQTDVHIVTKLLAALTKIQTYSPDQSEKLNSFRKEIFEKSIQSMAAESDQLKIRAIYSSTEKST